MNFKFNKHTVHSCNLIFFSYLEYHGFEEYDGGRLSRVGRQTPAVMVPPGWPEPELKKGSYLSL